MRERANVLWGRFKANRVASSLVILLTLALGILIGTIVSGGVRGQEKKVSDTSLVIRTPWFHVLVGYEP